MKKYFGATVVVLVATAMIFSSFAIAADTDLNPFQLSAKARVSTDISKIKDNLNRDDIVWDNGGTISGGKLYSSQNDQVYPFVSQVADDFQFTEDTMITDIHWYGGFWNGNPFDPVDFNIYIYADDGTGNKPTGNGLPDPSPTALWFGFYPGVTGLPLDPNGFYSYEVTVNPPFPAVAGTKYWLAVQAVFPFPPQWGWANTNQIHLKSAVQGFPFIGTLFWTVISPEVDMAFYLTGQSTQPPVPAISCEGNLLWEKVKAGSTVNGSFVVSNSGEAGSLLNWEVDTFPEWGTWTFTPSNGTGLADGDSVTITVEVVAPAEKKKTFTGKIKMINSDDPTDFCEIDVSLTTPRARIGFNLLQWILQKYPNMFPLLRHILA